MKSKKLHNKEDKNNKNNINKIEGQKPNKRSLNNDKLKLINISLIKSINIGLNFGGTLYSFLSFEFSFSINYFYEHMLIIIL